MEKIAGISTTAPLWNGVSYEKLTEIVEMLSRASYCFADDSAREWGKAQTLVAAAAKAINQHKQLTFFVFNLILLPRKRFSSFFLAAH